MEAESERLLHSECRMANRDQRLLDLCRYFICLFATRVTDLTDSIQRGALSHLLSFFFLLFSPWGICIGCNTLFNLTQSYFCFFLYSFLFFPEQVLVWLPFCIFFPAPCWYFVGAVLFNNCWPSCFYFLNKIFPLDRNSIFQEKKKQWHKILPKSSKVAKQISNFFFLSLSYYIKTKEKDGKILRSFNSWMGMKKGEWEGNMWMQQRIKSIFS